jgi:threonylcarbamoyladenosine tRNA methylthiotransferase MtaB
VNTCTVTAKSDRSCRHEIHQAKRIDPGCLLVVTGCFAQVAAESIAALPGVDLVLGNPDKQMLAQHVAVALQERAVAALQERATGPEGARAPRRAPVVTVSDYAERPEFESESFAHFHGRTRAFLKIQTGCDCHCTYCIVPLARGPARSMLLNDVRAQVRLLATNGYREIVLTGIDLGSSGRDTGEGRLSDLLERLLDDVPGVDHSDRGDRDRGDRDRGDRACGEVLLPVRLRLSSVEPLEVDAGLLDVVELSGDRIARHFHLPLQSGSDSVLSRMGRPYSAATYLEVASGLAGRLPDAAIGADVIVGFPGETEAEFQETLALVEASPLTYLHVFGYSDRPGTAAASMQPKIAPEVIKERSERLRALGARKKDAFRGRLVGSNQRALVLEERADDGRRIGLTGNYMEVLVPGDETLPNRFVCARLDQPLPGGRWEVTILDREP